PEEPEIFKVVEQMPRFPGCENVSGSDKDKENCAKEKMLQYIYKNLKYPAIARENGVEGMTVLQFVVSEDGSVKDINVVRDIGAGCGDAAKKVVEGMNRLPQKWTPGKQRGRPVKVLYTLPVKFKLE
ncbi:MAG: energy transducer TonB, partial [Bacteroidia bacterium]|nr:energy transducer TonB [Bacteroidia bacterium]